MRCLCDDDGTMKSENHGQYSVGHDHSVHVTMNGMDFGDYLETCFLFVCFLYICVVQENCLSAHTMKSSAGKFVESTYINRTSYTKKQTYNRPNGARRSRKFRYSHMTLVHHRTGDGN